MPFSFHQMLSFRYTFTLQSTHSATKVHISWWWWMVYGKSCWRSFFIPFWISSFRLRSSNGYTVPVTHPCVTRASLAQQTRVKSHWQEKSREKKTRNDNPIFQLGAAIQRTYFSIGGDGKKMHEKKNEHDVIREENNFWMWIVEVVEACRLSDPVICMGETMQAAAATASVTYPFSSHLFD